MPTTSEILGYAPGAGYLASNAKGKSVMFPNFGRLNPILPQQIYALYFILNKIHTEDSSYIGLYETTKYLWEIMGRYGLQAQGLAGGGGVVPSPTPNQGFPIYITQANFTSATFYPNTNIFGNTVIIFLNEVNRYLIPGIEFEVLSTGINIINTPGGTYLDGFDALTFTYNLVIEKTYT